MLEDRRKFERKRVLRRGRIVFRKGYGVIDCVVLDLSAGGARLSTPGLLAMPERFELRLENGPSYAVEVVSRGLETTGVRFLDAA
jgi:hypothetical protein